MPSKFLRAKPFLGGGGGGGGGGGFRGGFKSVNDMYYCNLHAWLCKQIKPYIGRGNSENCM